MTKRQCTYCKRKKDLNNFTFDGKLYSKKCNYCLEWTKNWHAEHKHIKVCCLACHDGIPMLKYKFNRHCLTKKHQNNLQKYQDNLIKKIKSKINIFKDNTLKDCNSLFQYQYQKKYCNNWINYYLNEDDNKSTKCQGICCSFYQEENRPEGNFCKIENKFLCNLCSI